MRLATNLQGTEARKNSTKKAIAHEPVKPARENHHSESGPTESAQYLALAARATNDALRDWNVKSGELSWPYGLETLLGHTDSAIAREIGFWQRHIHPDDRARTAAGIRDALATGEHWTGEYRFRRADGIYLQLLERALIVRNEKGEAIRLFGSLMDITARKQLHDQVVRSQKMEAFGQLAGGVAHDFNNFLTTILGYSDLLLSQPAVKGEIAKHITEIRNAASRASALTAQLLAFSRKHPLDARVLELNTLIGNLERSVLRLIGENISVECELGKFKDGGYIKVDPGQMTQIILNLVVNARDAMPTGGKLRLTTDSFQVGKKTECEPETLAPGDYLTISVSDTGLGMSEAVKAHLFEPFFTTKDASQCSGLGLATSYGIIRQSGGHICVESKVGRGTTVTIYIPRVPPPSYKKPNLQESPTGTETILVLEDDVGVRHISVRTLRGLGYDVIEAATAEDAQRLIAQKERCEIHLLLTDVIMPKMSGHHFADWMREACPTTKVIFISGYLDAATQVDNLRDQTTFFLPKPFDANQLALKVREALDAKTNPRAKVAPSNQS